MSDRRGDDQSGGNDYTVGYGRPPKSGQFKSGQSGNPKGRPKGVKSLQGHLDKLLDGRIVIADERGKRRVTRREALAMRLMEKAMNGDPKALQAVVQRDAQRFGAPGVEDGAQALSPVEEELLAAVLGPREENASSDTSDVLQGDR